MYFNPDIYLFYFILRGFTIIVLKRIKVYRLVNWLLPEAAQTKPFCRRGSTASKHHLNADQIMQF
jgi:hypothetical protein